MNKDTPEIITSITDLNDLGTPPITIEPTSDKHESSKDRKDHSTPRKVLDKRDTKDRLLPKEDTRKRPEESPKKNKSTAKKKDNDNYDTEEEGDSKSGKERSTPERRVVVTKDSRHLEVERSGTSSLKREFKGKKADRSNQHPPSVSENYHKSVVKRTEGPRLKSWWCLHCHGWKDRKARHTSSV